MPKDGESLAVVVGDPIELNHTAFADEWEMTVPRMIGAQERDQGAAGSGRFGGDILDAVARAKHAQTAPGIVPGRIHIKQHGYDLAGRVVVNLAVVRIATPANRDCGRTLRKIELEFVLEGFAELFTFQRVDHSLERGTEFKMV